MVGVAGAGAVVEWEAETKAVAMIVFRAPATQSFRHLFCLTLHHLFLFLVGTLANKLNVPQVLLPFSREPGRVPFLLEAQRGCYTW